jgi:hypothetical protein
VRVARGGYEGSLGPREMFWREIWMEEKGSATTCSRTSMGRIRSTAAMCGNDMSDDYRQYEDERVVW